MREPAGQTKWPSPREIAGELAVLAVIALILAALGPFGSFALGGFGARLAYWLPASLLGYVIFRPIAFLVFAAAERLGVSQIAAMLIAIAIAAFPASAAMLWLGGMRFDHEVRLADLVQLYFQVALIGGVIGTFFMISGRRDPAPSMIDAPFGEGSSEAPADAARAAFFDRLPPHWDGRLVALEMEDHYVRAHGPDGQSVLILMRMADAERELADADGARVHRSWWVMREAVTGRRRVGRNLVLALNGTLEAPVARDRLAQLRSAGWPV